MWWSRRSVSQGLREQHQVRWTHAVNAASTRGSNQAAQLGAEGAGCRAQVVQQLGQDVWPRLQGGGGRGQGGALVLGGSAAAEPERAAAGGPFRVHAGAVCSRHLSTPEGLARTRIIIYNRPAIHTGFTPAPNPGSLGPAACG